MEIAVNFWSSYDWRLLKICIHKVEVYRRMNKFNEQFMKWL